MLVSVITSLIVAKSGSADNYKANHWSEWVIRGLVLLSFCSQTALVLLGSRRKYKPELWVKFILWVAYGSSDWVTSYSLGVLSHDNQHCTDHSRNLHYVFRPFWAPIFLLQLCSPDTITGYSMQDNELWLRNFFSIGGKFGVTIYILVKSWSWSPLKYQSIALIVSGLIKFGERNWVQWNASRDKFRESMLPCPDPGPNYAKFMDEYNSREAEGYKIDLPPLVKNEYSIEISDPSNIPTLDAAFYFFGTFKRLFADLILSLQDLRNSQAFFQVRGAENAFTVVEIELGFIYDVLYTKAIVNYSRLGFLRLVSSFVAIYVFITFLIKCGHELSNVDVVITFVLLLGAILQELHATILLSSSDWTTSRVPKPVRVSLIPFLRHCHLIPAEKRWSNSMAQYNLLSFSLTDITLCSKIQKFLHVDEEIEKHRSKSVISDELKKLVFDQVLKKSRMASDIKVCKQLCACRGDRVLENNQCLYQLGWSIEVDFDQSILLWHVATDLCYCEDENKNFTSMKRSKLLSDYMLYLLLFCPFMLPNGIGQIRFQDTCAEAREFFQERKSITNKDQACTKLLQVNTKVRPSEVKGDRSKSVLFDACRLAKDLKGLDRDRNWRNGEKWEMMSNVWVEMLLYAASHCGWQNHAKQLTEGGELLTHVWLLMAHLGISEQIRISSGHGRVKLVVR